jgi:hypothetical protein
MTNGRTVDEIVASVDTAHSELGKLERELQEEIDEIRISAARAGRSPNPTELQRLKELRAEKAEARQVLNDLVIFTLIRLNESGEIAALQRKMDEINVALRDDLEDLKRIERYAEIAAKVADALAKATEKLASLAAGSPV